MSDQNLEARLDALFAETKVFDDAAEFVVRTQRRLRHRRRTRFLVLTLIGTMAVLLSAYLLTASGVLVDLAKAFDLALHATGKFGFYWVAVAALAGLTLYHANAAWDSDA